MGENVEMINKKCLTVGTMMALSAVLAGCGASETKEVTKTNTTVTQTEVKTETEVENVAVEVENVEVTQEEEKEIASSNILPEITGEFVKFTINGQEIEFGKTTLEELDTVFDNDEISEAEAMVALFGIPSKIENEEIGYKYHFYDMSMAAFGIEVSPGNTPVVGFMVDNDVYKLDDEIANLTVDDLVEKFGDYKSNEDGVYLWDTDECMFKVVYEDGSISTFAVVNKQMAEFVSPVFKEKIENKKLADESVVEEEIEIVSKNNLTGDVSNLYPTLHIGDFEVVLGETMLVEDEELEQYLYEKFSGRSGYGFNGSYSWTFGGCDDESSITLSGIEVPFEDEEDDRTQFIIYSVAMDIVNPEDIDVDEFKTITVDDFKSNLGTPYNDGSDLVWENDDVEIRLTVENDELKSIKVSNFKYAYEQKNSESSLMDIDISEELANSLVESFSERTLEEYPDLLMKSFLELEDEEEAE